MFFWLIYPVSVLSALIGTNRWVLLRWRVFRALGHQLSATLGFYFLTALLHCNLDVERLGREYDLDEPSIVRYLGKLEDLGLVEVEPAGRIKSRIPPPYRTGGPAGLDDQKRAFMELVLAPETEGRRILMAGFRMTRDHYEELKVAARDLVLEHGVRAWIEEIASR